MTGWQLALCWIIGISCFLGYTVIASAVIVFLWPFTKRSCRVDQEALEVAAVFTGVLWPVVGTIRLAIYCGTLLGKNFHEWITTPSKKKAWHPVDVDRVKEIAKFLDSASGGVLPGSTAASLWCEARCKLQDIIEDMERL